MISNKLTIFLLFLSTTVFCQNNTTELPISYLPGYGPFNASYANLHFGGVPEEYPLYKALSSYQYKNIPTNLKDIEKGLIMMDPEQLINQNYLLHNISNDQFKALLSYAPTNILRSYTKDPIASVLLYLKGTNDLGKEVLLLDCNNNGDFGDEIPFEPEDFELGSRHIEANAKNSKQVRYEIFNGKEILSKEIPIRILKKRQTVSLQFPSICNS
jgi:hypothetical protein